jgi:prepilin-type N-terminal cleavage/methylation domain-containing protein
MFHGLQHRRRSRRGFTLLELCLVLAVLAAVAAIVWPALHAPFALERLKRGADQVRAAWIETRVEAMTSGTIQAFRFEPGTGQYCIERFSGLDYDDPAALVDAFAFSAPLVAPEVAVAINLRELPEGIVFLLAQTELDARAQWALAQGGMLESIPQAPPILFYPDGTASQASIYLIDEQQNAIRIDLRGLTGVVTIGETVQLEAAP